MRILYAQSSHRLDVTLYTVAKGKITFFKKEWNLDRLVRTVVDPSTDRRTPDANADALQCPLFLFLDHLVLGFAREKTSAHDRSWGTFHLQLRRSSCHFRF
jgi:hypothetical protein